MLAAHSEHNGCSSQWVELGRGKFGWKANIGARSGLGLPEGADTLPIGLAAIMVIGSQTERSADVAFAVVLSRSVLAMSNNWSLTSASLRLR
jgi:hypothetical protein